MARARNIKPGFFVNPDLIDCSLAARLLFIGLWTLADKEGRLEDRPRHIKVQLFPGDDLDIDALLDELASRNFVTRYEALGKRCVFIPNFKKHQNPHKNEAESTLPPIQCVSANLNPLPEHSSNYRSAPADSLIPFSLKDESLLSESIREEAVKKIEEDKGEEKKLVRPTPLHITFAEYVRGHNLTEIPPDWVKSVRLCAKSIGVKPEDVPRRTDAFWRHYMEGKGKDFTSPSWDGKFWEWFKSENRKTA